MDLFDFDDMVDSLDTVERWGDVGQAHMLDDDLHSLDAHLVDHDPLADPTLAFNDFGALTDTQSENHSRLLENELLDTLAHVEPFAFDHTLAADDLSTDLSHWHQQADSDTCAIAAQEFVIESITGHNSSEGALRDIALQNGWYVPNGGTPLAYVGQLIEAQGIDVEQQFNTSLEQLLNELKAGHKVLAAVDADELSLATHGQWENETLGDLAHNGVPMPGHDANHVVQVVGIDTSAPQHPQVILNDPGHANGRGARVPLEYFVDAWADSGNFMVHTTDAAVVTPLQTDWLGRGPMLGTDRATADYHQGWSDWNSDMADYKAYHGDYDSAASYQKAADREQENADWYA